MMRNLGLLAVVLSGLVWATGCNNADTARVGAECAATGECENEDLTCLTQFKGGYCGASGCTSNADCVSGSICVTHDDGVNYCFRTCVDKEECNANRTVDNEANCSSNIVRVEGGTEKACVPPSSGI